MTDTPASRAASASGTALLAFIATLAFLVFHTTESDDVRPFVVVLCTISMTVTGLLHLIFLALLARRTGRSVAWIVAGAVFTAFVGSAVGLLLYEWYTKVDRSQPPQRPA